MKNIFAVITVFSAFTIAAAAQVSGPSVTILQPTASSSTSPVTVAATVDTPVVALQLYVDGTKVTEARDTNLNTSVTLPVGDHRIAVQAIDKSNNITKAVKSITVTAPPQPMTTFSNLQESTNWVTCGACGNNGGQGQVASYSMNRGFTNPAIDSQSTSAQFTIGGNYAYTNAYWYLRNTAPTTNIQRLVYDFWVYVPSDSATAPQAIEFECQHRVNGFIHNFAWQADYATKSWRTFDYTSKKWIGTAVPFATFTPDKWHHVVAEYHEEGSNTVHDALTIDGVRTVVNIVRAAKPTTNTWAELTNGFQLDLNGKPTAYSVYVDKMTVSYQ